ncbi:MAG: ferredoxin-type protein NapF [Zoogloeaceae bacterium]|jgi:ferredoxin-type protein NapF|nr:ferredoxin-type protein NapF [Zoogloeaceae bacterium]
MDISRRAFLRGQRLRETTAVSLRPPWSVDETLFTSACTRCGACVTACPTGLLAKGAGGFPEADFKRARCTFCADCVQACAKNARQNASSPQLPSPFISPDLPPWTLRALIGATCLPHQGVLCRSCEDHCEEGAIRFTLRQGHPAEPQIAESRCTGCGECVASCPAQAIFMRAAAQASGLDSTPFLERGEP